MKNPLILLIKLYQLSRPLRQPACRYYPSCSSYALGCLEKFGLIRGVLLTAFRICRCHPFCAGGIEYPPEVFSEPFGLFVEAVKIRSNETLNKVLAAANAVLAKPAPAKSIVQNKRS